MANLDCTFSSFRLNFVQDFQDIAIHDYKFLTHDELEELCVRSKLSLRQKLTARRFRADPISSDGMPFRLLLLYHDDFLGIMIVCRGICAAHYRVYKSFVSTRY